MATYTNTPNVHDEINIARNDIAPYGDDTLGENTGDSGLDIDAKENQDTKAQTKKPLENDPRVETVVPDNDN